QRRLRVALAALKLSLARRRGHLADVLEQVEFLNAPIAGQSDEDIALGSDLRAVALMNLGTLEAWSLASPDAERHLREGAVRARHQAAYSHGERHAGGRPRPAPRGGRGVRRGRTAAIAADGFARPGEPGDRLAAGDPGPPRDDRRSPRRARGAR